MSKESINDLKSRVSFISLLELHGWQLDRRKSTRKSLTFSNGADQIYLHAWNGANHFDNAYYKNRFTNQGGDMIQFLIDQQILGPDGPIDDFKKAVTYLKSLTNLPEPSFSTEVKPKGPFIPYRQIPVSDDSYLVQRRHIDLRYLKQPMFRKNVFQTIKAYNTPFGSLHANIFPYYINSKVHGQEIRNHNYEYFVDNSNISQAIWHSALIEDADFFIAESAIDAISYGQLNNIMDGFFITSGGSISQHQLIPIFNLYQRLNGNHIFVLGDNDVAGAKFNLTIILNLLHQQLNLHYLVQQRDQELHVYTQLAEPYLNNSDVRPSYIIENQKESIQSLVDKIIVSFKLNITQSIPITKDFNKDLEESVIQMRTVG